MRKIILSTSIVLLACSASDPTSPTPATDNVGLTSAVQQQGPSWRDQLTQQLAALVADSQVPGAEVALVGDDLEYAHAFGVADKQTGRAMTTTTPVVIMSISKLVIAASLMQLWERHKFELDDAVDKYLPYSVRNPGFSNVPITFKMLLAHASSIADNSSVINYFYAGLPPIPLSDFVQSYFDSSTGTKWDPANNFFSYAPGTDELYVDMDFVLLGALLERLSGESIQDYTQKHVFAPLEMQAKWNVTSISTDGFGMSAMPYSYDPASGSQTAIGAPYTMDIWPAAGISTDVVSLSHFMIAFMNDGAYRRGRILKPGTIAMMQATQYPDLVDWGIVGGALEGLGFDIYQPPYTVFDDHRYVGHWGAWIGYAAGFWMRPDVHVGAIVLTNSDVMIFNEQSFGDAVAMTLELIGTGASHH